MLRDLGAPKAGIGHVERVGQDDEDCMSAPVTSVMSSPHHGDMLGRGLRYLPVHVSLIRQRRSAHAPVDKFMWHGQNLTH